VFAVWCGIAGEKTIEHIAEIYKDADHFDTGFMGTDILLDVLFENGYQDIAYSLLNSREKGTFLYMKDNGATTLWERFERKSIPTMNSHCHPMYGAVGKWLYSHLAGITPLTAGYETVRIQPYMPTKLLSAQALASFVQMYSSPLQGCPL
jgi:alpha-L-rhamnosidase